MPQRDGLVNVIDTILDFLPWVPKEDFMDYTGLRPRSGATAKPPTPTAPAPSER